MAFSGLQTLGSNRFGVREAVANAIRLGMVEFIVELIESDPDFIMHAVDEHMRIIFSFATMERQEKIFNLIYELGPIRGQLVACVDEYGNNMLHHAALLAPLDQLDRVSGAALQMQRELQWFKEVESIVQPLYKERRNMNNQTPADLFREQHRVLVQEGRKWTKDVASSCTVVAALIATIMFAAAVFTVPGGYDEKSVTSSDTYAPYLPLHKAVRNGDLNVVKIYIDSNPSALTAAISEFGTALHVAAMTEHINIVEELVNRMTRPEYFEIIGDYGASVISLAASGGVVKIAKLVLARNTSMLSYIDQWGNVPVVVAGIHGHDDMTRYLYSLTPPKVLNPVRGNLGVRLAIVCIIADVYEIALDLLQQHPLLAIAEDTSFRPPTILMALSYKSSAFLSGSKLNSWQKLIYSCIDVQPSTGGNMIIRVSGINRIYNEKMKHVQAIQLLNCASQLIISNGLQGIGVRQAVANAIRLGIVEFIVELTKSYPDFITRPVDEHMRTIFSFATMERQEKIFNLIFELGLIKGQIVTCVDEYGNNMLHHAALLAPLDQLGRVSGAALQMQRELQWFKEVENIVQPEYKERRNMNGQTPVDLFREQHKVLVQEGEKWMKDTATSCTVVAALIATIMFAVAFTVPGGYDEKSGVPRYLHRNSFMVFIVADALSLFSSSTSVLMFLGILTSRYRQEDFLKSLPTKLIIGLSALFFSLATMMISFGTTLVIVLVERLYWIALPIILIASIPVTLFALLQYPLLVEIFISTYGPGIFVKPKKCWYQVMYIKFISLIQPNVW